MKQQIKAILEEERGVSPVIGVILMVAITVILAAVIGTFVLGLGDSLNQAPQAQLDAELNSGDHVEISHNGGDTIATGDLQINIGGDGNTDFGDSSESSNTTWDNSEFSVGDTAEFDSSEYSSGATVQIIHTPSESIILDTTV